MKDFLPNLFWTAKQIKTRKGKDDKNGNVGYYNNKGLQWMRERTEGDYYHNDVKKNPPKVGSRSIIKYKQPGFEGTTSKHRELKTSNRILNNFNFSSEGNHMEYPYGNTWLIDAPVIGPDKHQMIGRKYILNSCRFRLQVANNTYGAGPTYAAVSCDYRIIIFIDKQPAWPKRLEITGANDNIMSLLGTGPNFNPNQANLFDINPMITKRIKILYDETFVVGPFGYGQMRTHEIDLDVKEIEVTCDEAFTNHAVSNQICMSVIPNLVGKPSDGLIVSAIATMKYYN